MYQLLKIHFLFFFWKHHPDFTGWNYLWVQCVCVHSVVSDSLWPHGLRPARLLCPWNFPGKNTGVGCHFLLQRIFPSQRSNLSLLHQQKDSLPLSHMGSPIAPMKRFYFVWRNALWFTQLLYSGPSTGISILVLWHFRPDNSVLWGLPCALSDV